jgi:peptidoglycan/LPS O-acetylase OafA/YrhL
MEIRKFRPDIEILRAIAVVIVVLAHAKLGPEGGFIGVDLFFVISGFLITSNLFSELQSTGTISLSKFYSRRILRILPASMFVLICTLVLSKYFLSPIQFTNYCWDAIASTFSVVNYRMAITGTDYFASSAIPSPFQHFWSLAVEEQFYLIWPILLILSIKIFGKFTPNSIPLIRKLTNRINLILILIITVSLYLSYRITSQSQPWAYFGIHTRAWQMAIGSILAINLKSLSKIPNRIAFVLGWLGVVGILLSYFLITEKTLYPSLWALFPTISAGLVIIGNIHKIKYSIESFLDNKIVRTIGKVSYSWYLVHWPLFVLVYYNYGTNLRIRQKILIVLGSFLLSCVSYRLIENPVRYSQYFKQKLSRVYGLGLALIILSLLLPTIILVSANFNTKNQSVLGVKEEITSSKIKFTIKESTSPKPLPANLVTPLQRVNSDMNSECQDGHDTIIPIQKYKCSYVNNSLTRTIAVLGDSHAQQWLDNIVKFGNKYNYKVVSYTKSGCSMTDIQMTNNDQGRNYIECYSWRKQALLEVQNLRPDVLIVSERLWDTSDIYKYKEYANLIKTFSPIVIKIVDTPRSSFEVPECLSKNQTDITKCNTIQSDAYTKLTIADQEVAYNNQVGIKNINPLDWFCLDGICPAVIGNIVVYKDNNHITGTYTNYIYPLFEQKLLEFVK